MSRARRIAFVALLVLAAGCDHATKQIAREALAGVAPVSLAADTVRLHLTENPGGFLSFGATLPAPWRRAFFLGLAPLALLAVAIPVWRARSPSRWPLFALGLIVGGGLANWAERLWNDGAVTDFVSLGVGPLRTGIFNLADVFVLAGVAILLATGFDGRPAAASAARAEPGGP